MSSNAEDSSANPAAGGGSMPTFSVIIPTYQRPAQLRDCLAAIAALDYPKHAFEVIVVDDGGSTDLSAVISEVSGRINIQLLRQPNAGPAAARNTGAASAIHDFLAFTDDDCMPHPDWLRQMAAALQAHPDALIGGECVNALPHSPYATASHTILDVVNLHFNRDHGDAIFFPSDNIGLSRQKFLEIGGFDPSFRCSEDRDLCDRWRARGWRLIFVPHIAIDHARRMGLRGFMKQHFGYGRGAYRFHKARQNRHSGALQVEGSFYMKCFRQPFKTHPLRRALPLAGLLVVWQVVNTAGFFWEALRSINQPALAVGRGRFEPGSETRPSSPALPAGQARK